MFPVSFYTNRGNACPTEPLLIFHPSRFIAHNQECSILECNTHSISTSFVVPESRFVDFFFIGTLKYAQMDPLKSVGSI